MRTNMALMLILLAGLFIPSVFGFNDTGCSFNQIYCHEEAVCEEDHTIEDPTIPNWSCRCRPGLIGDGLKGDNHTGCTHDGEKLCKVSKDCHVLAYCNAEDNCVCNEGYHGDGWIHCNDTDECSYPDDLRPCHKHADCENTDGGYECTCNETKGYLGNGTYCEHTCTMDSDCHETQQCINLVCICRSGYREDPTQDGCIDVNECIEENPCDGNATCTNTMGGVECRCNNDINECVEENPCDGNATCTNTMGGVECRCNNGHRGNGETCNKMPINCDEIKQTDGSSKSGTYDIDPDFEDHLGTMEVYCDMRSDYGITVLNPKIIKKMRMTTSFSNYSIAYEHTTEEIKAVINSSMFCYQTLRYECRWGATLFDGDDYLVDGNGNQYPRLGSSTDNTCPCGEMGYCRNRASLCNCNGTTEYGIDEGKEIDKNRLPILRLVSKVGQGRADVLIGAVKCAPKPHDFPKDCHDAKFNNLYNAKDDGAWLIDPDGETGKVGPFLVHCDMKSETHVGITHLPTTMIEPKNVTSAGNYTISYKATQAQLEALINESDNCQQFARYDCQNSALMNNGDKRGYFWDIRGEEKDYWPGGKGWNSSPKEWHYKCGCGLLENCVDDSYGCNCDSKDGEWHKDFGTIYDKNDLPIGDVTFLDLGGEGQNGKFFVGDLVCSQKQFGIKPLCQDYLYDDNFDSHAYMIDPDGAARTGETDNQDPFLVQCDMTKEPPNAATIVYHNQTEIEITSSGAWYFEYKESVLGQLTVLVQRSYSCSQTIQYTCNNAPIHVNGTSVVTWTSRDGEIRSYFDGPGPEAVCRCGLLDECPGDNECNCDVGDIAERIDSGLLINKDDLPITQVDVSDMPGNAALRVGPLECKDLYPNCAELKAWRNSHKLYGESNLQDGFYTINPGYETGVEPFIVECMGSRTIVPVDIEPNSPLDNTDPDTPKSQCFTVKYKTRYNNTDYEITPDQIQALVNNSRYCSQELKQSCTNAPLTGFSNFSTCSNINEPVEGWAGSEGRSECGCSYLNRCAGGKACNCDLEDGQSREDGSWMHNKSRLAVCQFCLGVDKLSTLNSSNPFQKRTVKGTVSDIICDAGPIGKTSSCQEWRNKGMTTSGMQMTDPDGNGPAPPMPFYCVISSYPPYGFLEILPKENETEIPPDGLDFEIEYYTYNETYLRAYIEKSGYCTQNVTLVCNNSELYLEGEYGWYSVDGEIQTYWAGNEKEDTGCAGVNGSCNCNLPGLQIDGGLIIDKSKLPVKRIELGPANGTRKVIVGPVKCFDIPRHCEEIRQQGLKKNPMRNNTYAIDPDQAGGEDIFPVVCDFNTDKSIGITIVPVIVPPNSNKITNSTEPGETNVALTYKSVSPEQIHALTEESGYCHQGIQYSCYKSPLINFNDDAQGYYTTLGGNVSSSFGVPGHPDSNNCACFVTKSCPEDLGCHCDAKGPMATVDYGHEVNKEVLPIEEVFFGGQTDPDASATFDVTDVRCGPKPFDLPKDCQEAYERGMKSGEAYILPSPNVEPFLVYCNMERGFGVAEISNDLEDGKQVTFGTPMPVTYYGADPDQLDALTDVSEFCYLPFKFECMHTKFLEQPGYFHWTGGDDNNIDRKYVAYGRTYKQECNCGRDGQTGQCGGSENKTYLLNTYRFAYGRTYKQECNCGRDGQTGQCGGSENKTYLLNTYRPCNCDANDGKLRIDAGIFNTSSKLPIEELFFGGNMSSNSSGKVTFGKLYCGDFDFDLDECKLGFHDCDEHAACHNKHGYYECRCKSGWQGYGRPDVWANGRDCHDNDECAMNYCPYSANCTNTPGAFHCTCKEGYKKIAPTKCKDIDECALGTDDCHQNATCTNLDGSYHCRCNRNFRGNGKQCYPIAECSCYGDPHCLSSDGARVDFQGTCQYVMSRDKCDNLDSTPTFELLIQNDARPEVPVKRPVSWVKNAVFRVYGTEISLLPNFVTWINGTSVNLPYKFGELIYISRMGKYVEVLTDAGVEVLWDGMDFIEIRTPGSYKNQTCGFCGNYNDNRQDDLILGPACQGTGTQTDNFFVFGNSWLDQKFLVNNPECVANCTPTDEPECEGGDRLIAIEACKIVWDLNGIFRTCLLALDAHIKDTIYDTCIYDACFTDGDLTKPVCDIAQMLFQECQNIGINIEGFRSEHCVIPCEENMEYKTHGPVNQKQCRDYVSGNETSTNTTSENGTQSFAEGCYCKEGFYMDVDKCVEKEKCGCIYDDLYYSIGDTITLGDCRSLGNCTGNDTMEFNNITCNENAECAHKNGRYGCHCKDGFYGNGVNCVDDPCDPYPCDENKEECVINSDKTEGYECLCKMGFTGNCTQCEDIDECKTGTSGCPYHSTCNNTIGGFECNCLEGFYLFEGECRDLNECDLTGEDAVCGNNSRCSNKIGTYHCPCCDGYEKDENGTCVETEGAVSNVTCCVCDVAICDQPGAVCGNDFKEYDSIADMIIANCEKNTHPNTWKNVNYYGNCVDSCNPNPCPDYQQCSMDEKENKPECTCKECSTAEIESDEPVCTKKLIIYPNICTFKHIMCHLDKEEELYPDMKPCHDKEGTNLFEPWSSWSPCSVTCGKGQQTKTRKPTRPLTSEQEAEFPLQVSKDCHEPACPDSVCFNKTCDIKAAECVEDDQGQAKCECRDCTNVGVHPVCGFVTDIVGGPRPITWESECVFRAYVCENKISDFELMHEGHCGSIPKNCTRVPDQKYLRRKNDPDYISDRKYSLNKCSGGCGPMRDDCCRPAKTSTISVPLEKGNSTVYEEFTKIEECECIPKEEVEQSSTQSP